MDFSNVRFKRDSYVVNAPVAPAELASFIARPDFDFVIAEPAGQDPRAGTEEFAQVANLDGIYRFEVSTPTEGLSGTMLNTVEEVVTAFGDWASQRPGWQAQHTWD